MMLILSNRRRPSRHTTILVTSENVTSSALTSIANVRLGTSISSSAISRNCMRRKTPRPITTLRTWTRLSRKQILGRTSTSSRAGRTSRMPRSLSSRRRSYNAPSLISHPNSPEEWSKSLPAVGRRTHASTCSAVHTTCVAIFMQSMVLTLSARRSTIGYMLRREAGQRGTDRRYQSCLHSAGTLPPFTLMVFLLTANVCIASEELGGPAKLKLSATRVVSVELLGRWLWDILRDACGGVTVSTECVLSSRRVSAAR